jgi:hypothetical protein
MPSYISTFIAIIATTILFLSTATLAAPTPRPDYPFDADGQPICQWFKYQECVEQCPPGNPNSKIMPCPEVCRDEYYNPMLCEKHFRWRGVK